MTNVAVPSLILFLAIVVLLVLSGLILINREGVGGALQGSGEIAGLVMP